MIAQLFRNGITDELYLLLIRTSSSLRLITEYGILLLFLLQSAASAEANKNLSLLGPDETV